MEISWNHCRDFTSFAKRARKNHSIKAMSYIWCYPVKPQPNGATNCLQTKISKPTGKKRTTFKAVCENISNSIISAAGAWEKLGKAKFFFVYPTHTSMYVSLLSSVHAKDAVAFFTAQQLICFCVCARALRFWLFDSIELQFIELLEWNCSGAHAKCQREIIIKSKHETSLATE